MGAGHTHLKLTREQQEQLEMEALHILDGEHRRRRMMLSGRSRGYNNSGSAYGTYTGSGHGRHGAFGSSGGSASGSNNSSSGDLRNDVSEEDLLFCI